MEKENIEHIKHEIKEIIYGYAKKGGMSDDLQNGQIIGLRTGEGLEFDMVTLGIAEWYVNKVLKIAEGFKSTLLASNPT